MPGRHAAGDVFYVVEEGSFTIYDDDENELARVGKGSCFGELALLRQVCSRPLLMPLLGNFCQVLVPNLS